MPCLLCQVPCKKDVIMISETKGIKAGAVGASIRYCLISYTSAAEEIHDDMFLVLAQWYIFFLSAFEVRGTRSSGVTLFRDWGGMCCVLSTATGPSRREERPVKIYFNGLLYNKRHDGCCIR
jgi:hypothetical protein